MFLDASHHDEARAKVKGNLQLPQSFNPEFFRTDTDNWSVQITDGTHTTVDQLLGQGTTTWAEIRNGDRIEVRRHNSVDKGRMGLASIGARLKFAHIITPDIPPYIRRGPIE